MPTNRRFDFMLGGKGFMCPRSEYKGRIWSRSGRSDTPGQRSVTDSKFGVLPDELDHPEVWDDWSGGFGHAYRKPEAPNTYHWAENFDARFPRQLVHCQAPQLLPSRYASINVNVEGFLDVPLPGASPPIGAGAVLAYGRGFVARYVPTGLLTTGSMFDSAYEASGGGATKFTGRAAVYGSYVYIGTEASSFVRRTMDGSSYTLGPMPGRGFTVAAGRLWKRNNDFLLQSAADPDAAMSTGGWSATLNVGNRQMAIQDMTSLAGQLYVGMPDGLYVGDTSATFVNVLPGPEGQANPDNGRDLDVINGAVIGPFADDLVYYHPSTTTAAAGQIGPSARHSDRSPVRGRMRIVRALGPWWYTSLWTGSQSWLLAGRADYSGNLYWQTQQRLPHVTRASRLHFDGITTSSGGTREISTRAWLACDASGFTGTAPLYVWPIPRLNGNPLGDDPTWTPNYCGSARIDLGAADWSAPGTRKLWRAVEVWADNLASGSRWCDVYYSVDDGERMHLGRATESPKTTLWFPSWADGFVTGQSIALSIESFTTTPTITPVYRSFVLRGSLLPRAVEVITAVARIGDNVRDRMGAQMRSGAAMITDLRDMASVDGTGARPQLLMDLAGATCWVNVLKPLEESESYQKGDENPEMTVTLKMAVLDMSVNLAEPLIGIEDVAVIPAS